MKKGARFTVSAFAMVGMLGTGLAVTNASTSNTTGMQSSNISSMSGMGGTMGGTSDGGGSLNTVDNNLGLMTDSVMLTSMTGSKVSGMITMTVTSSGLQASGKLSGLTPGGTYMPLIRLGEPGNDAGSEWTMPSVQADTDGDATLNETMTGIKAIPEDGWYFRLDSGSMPVATGVIGQTLPSTTTVETLATSSYLISLQIGSLGKMIASAQAAKGAVGDIMVPMPGMSMPGMSMMFDGEAVNHHLEMHIFNLKTGEVQTNLMPTATITSPATGTTSVVQSAAMYGSDVGLPDYHYGNDVYLQNGMVDITVIIGSEKVVFNNVPVAHPDTSGMTGGMSLGMGSMSSSRTEIAVGSKKFAFDMLPYKDPQTYQEESYIPIWYVMQALKAEGIKNSWHVNTWTIHDSMVMTELNNHFSGKNSAEINMNGNVVTYPRIVGRPYKGAQSTTYLPLPDIAVLLHGLGLQQSWNGSTLTLEMSGK